MKPLKNTNSILGLILFVTISFKRKKEASSHNTKLPFPLATLFTLIFIIMYNTLYVFLFINRESIMYINFIYNWDEDATGIENSVHMFYSKERLLLLFLWRLLVNGDCGFWMLLKTNVNSLPLGLALMHN
ncbi:hypothetical protein ACJX0J_031675 [Zea mays]